MKNAPKGLAVQVAGADALATPAHDMPHSIVYSVPGLLYAVELISTAAAGQGMKPELCLDEIVEPVTYVSFRNDRTSLAGDL